MNKVLAISLYAIGVFTFSSCATPPAPSVPPAPPEAPEQDGGSNETTINLDIPEGFKISEFATGLSGARVLVGPDGTGKFWLSRTSEGIVSSISLGPDGEVAAILDDFSGLNEPHGLVLDPSDPLNLYIAESDKVSRVRLDSEAGLEKLVDLPDGGRHFTRTLYFGPDSRLYVSIGSSCDVCIESDERRAKVYVMDKDDQNFTPFATGLRNSVFLTTDPVTGEIWATDMGRDNLGDNLPPDEVNILEARGDYGWPYCYGQKIRDSQFMPNLNPSYCQQTISPKVELQAHSAPLGLAFIPEEGWPEDMWLDLVVAYHGSWNRSVPTGYKLVKVNLDLDRQVLETEDFITGWLDQNGQVIGRPVDVLAQPGGTLYITDDFRGVIYKLERTEIE